MKVIAKSCAKKVAKSITQGALLNPEPPIPDGALQFEESLEYIFFEGDLTEGHITFET
jgi:hypothetical protein